jgi:hypothetical protein
MEGKPDRTMEAKWNQELRVQPQDRNQVISLTGGAELLYAGVGQLSAGEIHFYLNEIPVAQGKRRFELEPDRMCAENNVRLTSPEIAGKVEALQVWFRRAKPLATDRSARKDAPKNPANIMGSRPLADVQAGASTPLPKRRFHVTGRLLQAKILMRDTRAEVDELILSDHVELIEVRTAKPDEKPVIIRGECIHVQAASQPHTTVGVKGKPAYFEGRGLTLTGTNLNLNRGTNRLWIDGGGWMDLPPMKRDLQGRPTNSSEPLRVYWNDGMSFDGRTAAFKGKVRAVSRLQQLRTEMLQASFDRMVRFGQVEKLDNRKDPYNIHEIRCQGEVWMQSQTYEQGKRQSFEQVETQSLIINNSTGELSATGPGYVESRQLGAAGMDQFVESSGMLTAQKQPVADASDPSKKDQLYYLKVRFQGGIRGNIHQREITFHGQVLTVFGPIEAWDDTLPEDNPDKLGPKAARMTTDALTVRQMPSPIDKKKTSIELQTDGNTCIESRLYTALCSRLAYDQRKGQVILQGDGRTRARLFRQETIGGPRESFQGQEILFWPDTGEARITGAGVQQINLPPGKIN